MLGGLRVLLLQRRGRLLAQQGQQPDLALDAVLERCILRGDPTRSEQLVHLLESAALCLGHEEDDVQDGEGGDAAEEDEGAVVGDADERGGEESDGEVVELWWLVSIGSKNKNRRKAKRKEEEEP